VELLLLRVRRLGQVAQEHRINSDVLPGSCKLRGSVGIFDHGQLDLTGACLRIAHNVTSIRLGVAPEVHRGERRLVPPPLVHAMRLGVSQACLCGSSEVCISSVSTRTGCCP
jgi:hypothetical protein